MSGNGDWPSRLDEQMYWVISVYYIHFAVFLKNNGGAPKSSKKTLFKYSVWVIHVNYTTKFTFLEQKMSLILGRATIVMILNV